MCARPVSEEGMIRLKESPYVLKVTKYNVFFSAEFKRLLYLEIKKHRKIEDVLIEHGIDPEILGPGRIAGLLNTIYKAKSPLDFRDGKSKKITLEDKVKFLEQQLVYKEQEIEFLKKIVSLGKKGARQ
jgi:hypothetical protein